MDFKSLDKGIKKLELENGLEEIPDYAFASFYNLKELNIPDSVKKIGKGAFQNCSSLINVTLPDNLTEISNNLFFHCKSLDSIALPESLLKIGDQAFFGTKIKSVKIPKSVITIGNSAFTGISEFIIYDSFNYNVNKYNIFTWLSEEIYDRETDGDIPLIYDFIKNVTVSILDDDTSLVKFKFFIPFRDKFDIFTISHEIFKDNRLDLSLLDSQFQRIRNFENKTKYVYYRVLYPYKLSDNNKNLFTRFITQNSQKIAEKFIDENTVIPLIKLSELGLITNDNVDKLVEYANINKKFNSLSYLMNYKHEKFSYRYAL